MRCDDEQVPAERWRSRCAELVVDGADLLDLMTAVDDPGSATVEVVVHLVDLGRRRRHLLRTRLDRAEPQLDSISAVIGGAAWREREVHEMHGVRFPGNPDLRPLLTTAVSEPPLRRTTPLPARLAAPWPGSRDPADRPAAGARTAARPRSAPNAPGIPKEWRS